MSSFIKTFIMMNGEINYETYFDWNKTKLVNAQWSTQIFLILFIIFFGIVLVNLLVGLAVSEIDKERQEANTLHNRLAVYEIDRHLKNLHRNVYFQFGRMLLKFFQKNSQQIVIPSNSFFDFLNPSKLFETSGVLKTLKREWDGTGIQEDFSWKVCIDPNKLIMDRI